MTAAFDRTRRTLLGAVAGLALGTAALPAAAQDAQSVGAQKAARDWLALTDFGDAKGSWSAAGAKFRAATPADGWGGALKKVRDPLGAVTARAVQATRFEKAIDGFPPGDYVIVLFRTSFAKREAGHETVTLEREADGQWRVIGYLIG